MRTEETKKSAPSRFYGDRNPRKSASKKGFSLIELIIVIGVIVTLATVGFLNLGPKRSRNNLNIATGQIAVLLRDAQRRAVDQENNTVWGVHFDNVDGAKPFYALFRTSYGAPNTVERYSLPQSVRYATTSVAAGGGLDITFAQISGAPSTSTTIVLELYSGGSAGGVSESVSRNSSGKVFFDDFNRTNL